MILYGIGAGALALGALVGYWLRQNVAKKQLSTAEGQAAQILEAAKKKAEEETLAAKNKAVEILEEAKKAEQAREEKFSHLEARLEKREDEIESEAKKVQSAKEKLCLLYTSRCV